MLCREGSVGRDASWFVIGVFRFFKDEKVSRAGVLTITRLLLKETLTG